MQCNLFFAQGNGFLEQVILDQDGLITVHNKTWLFPVSVFVCYLDQETTDNAGYYLIMQEEGEEVGLLDQLLEYKGFWYLSI